MSIWHRTRGLHRRALERQHIENRRDARQGTRAQQKGAETASLVKEMGTKEGPKREMSFNERAADRGDGDLRRSSLNQSHVVTNSRRRGHRSRGIPLVGRQQRKLNILVGRKTRVRARGNERGSIFRLPRVGARLRQQSRWEHETLAPIRCLGRSPRR
jgi:hypothetical protein